MADIRLKVLYLSNEETEASIFYNVLKKARIDAEILVVDKKILFVNALMGFSPEVILSDDMPSSFSTMEALDIFLRTRMKIPFILITDTISENIVFVIKAGANDFVLKKSMEKLPASIINSIEEIAHQIKLEAKKSFIAKNKTNAVIAAHEQERNKMSYALLENVNQILAASILYIDCATAEEDKRIVFMLDSKKHILTAIDEIKRLSYVIMPPNPEEMGLVKVLNNWIQFKRQSEGINFTTSWKNINDQIIDQRLKLTIYRIIQEQLDNITKYNGARNIHISLEQTADALSLMIKDDDNSLDMSKTSKDATLKNINTRMEIHSGKMMFESEPGEGSILS